MKIYSLLKTILFCNIILQNTNAQQSSQYAYKVTEKPWNESFGNHRAVLEITNPAEVIALDFQKELNVEKGLVQVLWFGIDIPPGQPEGTYNGTVTISDRKGIVPINIHIDSNELSDCGDSELWRHSWLRWLNSTLGIADTPTTPYTTVRINKNQFNCLGRNVTIDKQTGLPRQIESWGTNLLESPVHFIIQTAKGIKNLKAAPEITEKTAGHVTLQWKAEDEELTVNCKTIMEFDGWINYIYTILPKKDIQVEDIRLEIPVKRQIGINFIGMGLPGQETPKEYNGKWDIPEKNDFGISLPTSTASQWWWPFDSFWIGNTHAGIHCELRGSSYSGPLLKLYCPAYPISWYNNDKGGFAIRKTEHQIKTIVYSGEREIKKDKPITFNFALLITPVKKVNMKSHFTDRYYHHGSDPTPKEKT